MHFTLGLVLRALCSPVSSHHIPVAQWHTDPRAYYCPLLRMVRARIVMMVKIYVINYNFTLKAHLHL